MYESRVEPRPRPSPVLVLGGTGKTGRRIAAGLEARGVSGRIVAESGLEWTVVRASWFFQNFSEGAFTDMVLDGRITLPVGDVAEPFVDVDDTAGLSEATGRSVEFVEVPHDAFIAGARESGAPRDVIWMLDYLFATVLDGRNARLADGVQRALGREPRDLTDYARDVVSAGGWIS